MSIERVCHTLSFAVRHELSRSHANTTMFAPNIPIQQGWQHVHARPRVVRQEITVPHVPAFLQRMIKFLHHQGFGIHVMK